MLTPLQRSDVQASGEAASLQARHACPAAPSTKSHIPSLEDSTDPSLLNYLRLNLLSPVNKTLWEGKYQIKKNAVSFSFLLFTGFKIH